jgi:hypothetical protein
MIILTNFILSAAATICLTVIVGMLAILVIQHPAKNEEGE